MPGSTLRIRGRPSVLLAVALAIGLSYGVFAAVHGFKKRYREELVIAGGISVPLYPGASQAVNLRLTNRYGFDIALMQFEIGLTLDTRHRVAGCSPRQDFRLVQIPGGNYPVLMRARSSATLTQLGVRQLPRLKMVDRDVDQSACRGTTVKLRYRVLVRKLRARERSILRRRAPG